MNKVVPKIDKTLGTNHFRSPLVLWNYPFIYKHLITNYKNFSSIHLASTQRSKAINPELDPIGCVRWWLVPERSTLLQKANWMCFLKFGFFFFFCHFLGRSCSIWRFPGEGSNRNCSRRPMPEPQQHGIGATSVTHTTAHGNAGFPTHWARPGIEPTTSWFLVRFVNHWAMMGTPGFFYCYYFFNGCTCSIWTCSGQKMNPSQSCNLHHSCGKTASFNALPQARGWTCASAGTWAAAVVFLIPVPQQELMDFFFLDWI